MEKENEVYTAIILPGSPPIDKVAAMALVERCQEKQIENIYFHRHPEYLPEEMAKLEAAGTLTIDLGSENYKKVDTANSATEFVAQLFFGSNWSPGIAKLVELCNKNNGKRGTHYEKFGGYLKGFYLSIPWGMRELYEIEGYDHVEVVRRVTDVIHAFLGSCDGEIFENRDDASLNEAIPDLTDFTRKCNFAPLTLGCYLRDLWRTGFPISEIYNRISWWVKAFQQIAGLRVQANNDAVRYPRREFQSGWAGGALVHNAYKMLVRELSHQYDLIIPRNKDGQTAILTNKLNVSALATELIRREPDRWTYNKAAGQIINGGYMYKDVAPTKLSDDDVIVLVQKYPPQRKYRH